MPPALTMMRYQSPSEDYLPLPGGGKKPNLKDENHNHTHHYTHHQSQNGRVPNFPSDGKAPRNRAPSPNPSAAPQDRAFPHFSLSTSDPSHHHGDHPFTNPSPSREPTAVAAAGSIGGGGGGGGGGDVLLQWGHRKRSRGSRADGRLAGDESSVNGKKPSKVQRRSMPGMEKQAASAAALSPANGSYSRGANLRSISSSMAVGDHPGERFLPSRAIEERSNGKKSPPSLADKMQRAAANNGCSAAHAEPSSRQPPEQDTRATAAAATTTEKVNVDKLEWPRIYISLSRKEKEEDFLAMKGTKLPHRPKKRPKNIEKSLQYCFPGMWLTDLTRARYEVREKKCAKKKRRGLKGMESMDTDSD